MADVLECAWCHTTPRVEPEVAERHVGGVVCSVIEQGIPCNFAVGLNGHTIPVDLWNEIMENTAYAIAKGQYGMGGRDRG